VCHLAAISRSSRARPRDDSGSLVVAVAAGSTPVAAVGVRGQSGSGGHGRRSSRCSHVRPHACRSMVRSLRGHNPRDRTLHALAEASYSNCRNVSVCAARCGAVRVAVPPADSLLLDPAGAVDAKLRP
jgi:hypothetical protein